MRRQIESEIIKAFRIKGSKCAVTCEYGSCFASDTTACFCDYLHKTGHKRPCPSGDACTVRIEKKKQTRKRKAKE